VRKRRQFEPMFGSSCYSTSVNEPEVEQLALRLLKSIQFHGISSVEFKRDPRDGTFKLMEINVRSPLMIGVAIDSGVDLPWLSYCELTGQPLPEATVRPTRLGRSVGVLWQDIHSARFYRGLGKLTLFQWARQWLKAREIHFAWDDLSPMRAYVQSMYARWKRGLYKNLPSEFQTVASWWEQRLAEESRTQTQQPRQTRSETSPLSGGIPAITAQPDRSPG